MAEESSRRSGKETRNASNALKKRGKEGNKEEGQKAQGNHGQKHHGQKIHKTTPNVMRVPVSSIIAERRQLVWQAEEFLR